jgi:hypothetical protein
MVAVLHRKCWRRGVVLDKEGDDVFRVDMVDFGREILVHRESMRSLPQYLKTVSQLSVVFRNYEYLFAFVESPSVSLAYVPILFQPFRTTVPVQLKNVRITHISEFTDDDKKLLAFLKCERHTFQLVIIRAFVHDIILYL